MLHFARLIQKKWAPLSESTLIMTYMQFAIVNDACPICGQGRVLVALEKGDH